MDFGNILYKALQFDRVTHRLFQKERSMFWEVTVSVNLRKKVHVNMCLILNGYRDTAVWIYRLNSIRSLFVGLEVYRGKVNTKKILAHILDAAAIEKREDQLKWTTHDLCTQVVKYIEVDGGIFEHFVISNKSVISV